MKRYALFVAALFAAMPAEAQSPPFNSYSIATLGGNCSTSSAVPYQKADLSTACTAGGINGQALALVGGVPTWTSFAGAGTVTSVAMSLPSIFSVTGSPITASGTLTGTLATQAANTFFLGPVSGAAAAPSFRAMLGADLPSDQRRAGAVTIGSSDATALNLTTNNTTRITADGSGNITVANSPNLQVNTRLNVSNSITGSPGTQYVANTDYVGTDTADVGTSFSINSSFQHSFGGAGTKGGRVASYSLLNQSAVTDAANLNRNYVAHVQKVQTATGDGGTGLTPATAEGAYFGIGPECSLLAGATNVFNCTAAEFDVDVATGASVLYKSIAQFATKPEDRVAGTNVDTMLWLYDQPNGSSPNHKFGALFGGPDTTVQWPFNNTSTIIGAQTSGGAINANHGVDFSAVTFAGSAFKSNGFSVDQSGSISGTNQTLVGTSPGTIYFDNGAGTDLKRFRLIGASGNYFLQHQTDSGATSTNAYQLNASANGPQSHTWFTSTAAGSANTQLVLSASGLTSTPKVNSPAHVSTGTVPTSSGTCVASSFVGGATAGQFTTASACSGGQLITLNFSQTAPNGWACNISNTNHVTNASFILSQSATSTTSATFAAPTMPSAADVMIYNCTGY